MKKQTANASSLGRASLLVIFSCLCLTIFALLSFSTVRAQQRLLDSTLEAVTEYYAAELEAQTLFARLRAGEEVPGVTRDGELYHYSCTIGPNQTLYVTLQKTPGGWTVLRWQAVAQPQTVDDSLPVWAGPEEEEP